MTRMHSSFRALLVILALTPAAETHAAWPRYPDVNVPVSTGAGQQVYPAIVEDGAGGAFIAWHDNRSGNYDIYVQRVSAAGVPQWTANGVVACSAVADQANARLIPDGAGGVIVTWHDFRPGNWDIYAQRMNGNGVAQWTANGVAVCQWAFDQPDPHLVPDGQGGAILAWEDQRGIGSGRFEVYAQRVNAAGVLQWPNSGGIPVCTASGLRGSVRLVPDGAGGAIISWRDARGVSNDIYAQRMSSSGTALWAVNDKSDLHRWHERDQPHDCIRWSGRRIRHMAGRWFPGHLDPAGEWRRCRAAGRSRNPRVFRDRRTEPAADRFRRGRWCGRRVAGPAFRFQQCVRPASEQRGGCSLDRQWCAGDHLDRRSERPSTHLRRRRRCHRRVDLRGRIPGHPWTARERIRRGVLGGHRCSDRECSPESVLGADRPRSHRWRDHLLARHAKRRDLRRLRATRRLVRQPGKRTASHHVDP